MSIVYSQSVGTLNTYPSVDGLSDVVNSVYVIYAGTDTDNPEKIATTGVLINLGSPNPDDYIEFSNLTSDVVNSWISNLGTDFASAQTVVTQMLTAPVPQSPPWQT